MNTVSENHPLLPAALDGGPISHPASYSHPHPDPAHVMRCYRGYLLKAKRQGSARGLIHYKQLLQTYLSAKRAIFSDLEKQNAPGVVS